MKWKNNSASVGPVESARASMRFIGYLLLAIGPILVIASPILSLRSISAWSFVVGVMAGVLLPGAAYLVGASYLAQHARRGPIIAIAAVWVQMLLSLFLFAFAFYAKGFGLGEAAMSLYFVLSFIPPLKQYYQCLRIIDAESQLPKFSESEQT